MGYSPWGHKESDMTEQLHLSKVRQVSLCFCETCLYKCSQRVKINSKEQKIKWKRKTDETTKIFFKSQNPNEQTDQGL